MLFFRNIKKKLANNYFSPTTNTSTSKVVSSRNLLHYYYFTLYLQINIQEYKSNVRFRMPNMFANVLRYDTITLCHTSIYLP